MKTRQLVFNDRRIAEFCRKEFIGVAASDVDYNQLPAEAKGRGEYRFLQRALTGAPHGIHQGIYVVTPSGKFLRQCNTGWPHLNPDQCLARMREALAAYRALPQTERRGTALKNSDRSMPPSQHVLPQKSWTKLRSVTRSYPFQDMTLFDLRHPVYYKIDKLWLSPESVKSTIPNNLTVGSQQEIRGQVLRHIVHDCHMMLGCPPWNEESVKSAKLSVKVHQIKGSLAELRYVGTFHLDSTTRWNKGSYQGKMLGRAIWDSKNSKFTQFRWVFLGERNRRELKPNETKGQVHVTQVASLIEIDPEHPNDRGIAPHRWHDGYPRAMKQQAGQPNP